MDLGNGWEIDLTAYCTKPAVRFKRPLPAGRLAYSLAHDRDGHRRAPETLARDRRDLGRRPALRWQPDSAVHACRGPARMGLDLRVRGRIVAALGAGHSARCAP